jgi:hypothetical protein
MPSDPNHFMNLLAAIDPQKVTTLPIEDVTYALGRTWHSPGMRNILLAELARRWRECTALGDRPHA